MPDPQPNPGDLSGNPNPAPGQAPAQSPAPAAPGKVQAPAGATLPARPVPLDRQGTPSPGALGEQTVPLRALQEEREKRQTLQQQVDQLTQQVQGMAQPPAGNSQTYYGAQQPAQQAPQSTFDAQAKEIEKLWEIDPRKAVRAEIDQSLGYYDTVNAQLEAQANFLASKYQDFPTYRQTAMNYIRTMPYTQRAQPGIVELAYMVARGQNVDNILKTRETELMDKFKSGQLAGALHRPAGASGAPLNYGQETQLTNDQRAAAAAMGLSEADYMANMKGAM